MCSVCSVYSQWVYSAYSPWACYGPPDSSSVDASPERNAQILFSPLHAGASISTLPGCIHLHSLSLDPTYRENRTRMIEHASPPPAYSDHARKRIPPATLLSQNLLLHLTLYVIERIAKLVGVFAKYLSFGVQLAAPASDCPRASIWQAALTANLQWGNIGNIAYITTCNLKHHETM